MLFGTGLPATTRIVEHFAEKHKNNSAYLLLILFIFRKMPICAAFFRTIFCGYSRWMPVVLYFHFPVRMKIPDISTAATVAAGAA